MSDLHLDVKQPDIGAQFLDFLDRDAGGASALYILGDLFESWVGDDDPQPERERIGAALRALTRAGTPCFFMRGNRDFLVGEAFAGESGLRLLDDEVVIEHNNERLLLMHGDSLCTDDLEYQAFRTQVRDPAWQRQFLALPLAQRLALARAARERSATHNAASPEAIMDVNQGAVEDRLRAHGVTRLLHGHTHRPAIHEFRVDDTAATRIVLGDWYEQGSVGIWDRDGLRLQFLPR